MKREEIASRVKSIIEEVYDESKVDFIKIYDTEYGIIIHYPEIELTNYYNKKHTIRDLYITFRLNLDYENDFIFKVYEANKATWTIEEAYKYYIHSHISYGEVYSHTFCFGATDISLLGSELALYEERSTESRLEKKFDNLELFFHMFNQWLSYESTNTTPYFHISNLKINNPESDYSPASNIDIDDYLSKFKNIPIIQDFNTGKFLVQDNDIFKSQLLELYPNANNLIRYIDENGDEVNTASEEQYKNRCNTIKENFLSNASSETITFKGKNIPYNVILPEFKDNDDTREKVICKEFRESFIGLLEEKINKFYYESEYSKYSSKIRRVGIRFCSQTDHILES